ncbi:hypothetical protein A256_03792 [Pseudomonas syringae pv. actinidiae ICMP 19103]|nr:hypothetical protein A256_03792 [Pseudomonas syringae pv. actinidiae ICMP 19103]EPM87335.1 hypothetical protein A260_13319 [Pseudomonas syringae pv. actinidiae ICMP 19068]EPM95577.1 hypothetical protein A259_32556 [Pseudomonas syringae pv. actinidiae ICMP 19070]EPM98736.1 hypothetical protein A258_03742 [Pseudomonas syringae pv. actinidiae ICMP 19104]EPN06216.1 hypothetical protein A253_03802 [Pseudomonas syringae pv. actinidiae ICMP 19102]EPN12422.1 hypothetical protein A252_03802 [Pseudom
MGLGLSHCLSSLQLKIFLRYVLVVVLLEQNIDSATKQRPLSFERVLDRAQALNFFCQRLLFNENLLMSAGDLLVRNGTLEMPQTQLSRVPANLIHA